MKTTYNFIYLISLLFPFIFFSCTSNNIEEQQDPAIEAINGKWAVSGNKEYTSFEFTESGAYIIEAANEQAAASKPVHLGLLSSSTRAYYPGEEGGFYVGKYQIISDTQVAVNGFGTITIISLSEDEFVFTLERTNGTSELYSASREPELPENNKTNLLCGIVWKGYIEENMVGIIIFSKCGTFLSISEGGGLGQWKWDSNGDILYSYDNWNRDLTMHIEQLTATYIKMHVNAGGVTFSYELYAIDTDEDLEDYIPNSDGIVPDINKIVGSWECSYNIERTKENGVMIEESVNDELGYIYTFNQDYTFELSQHYQGDWYIENNKFVIKNDGGYPFRYTVLQLDQDKLVIEATESASIGGNIYVVYRKYIFQRVE